LYTASSERGTKLSIQPTTNLRGVDAAFFSDRTFEYPGWQRCVAQCVAGVDVFLDPLGHRPARCLPGFERTDVPAEAPAHGEVDVARVVGHGVQVHGDVVESVAEDRPQELRLRVGRFAQPSSS
jgi:xanthine/CO dehydrogenase XdhC/CoxF family maturation factor